MVLTLFRDDKDSLLTSCLLCEANAFSSEQGCAFFADIISFPFCLLILPF